MMAICIRWRSSSIFVASVLSLLISLNFILPTLFRVTAPSSVSDAPEYLYTAVTLEYTSAPNNAQTTTANTMPPSNTKPDAGNMMKMPPAPATPNTIVPGARSTFDDALTWKIDVPSKGGLYDLPVFILCNWYGDGRHRRLKSKLNRTRTVATTGRAGIPAKVALPSSGEVRFVTDLPCQALLKEHNCGLGNWVLHTYLLRMASMHTVQTRSKAPSVTRVSQVQMTCKDINESNRDVRYKTLVLPWLMGNFSGHQDRVEVENYWKSNAAAVFNSTILTQCSQNISDWIGSPVLYMLPFIRQDLRRLAVNLVGPPKGNPNHPAHDYLQTMLQQQDQDQQNFKPLLTKVELDDAAIHFRCGDIMADSSKGARYFHFIKFRSISDLILPVAETIRSIGIVTQPFPKNGSKKRTNKQARWRDNHDDFGANLCVDVTRAFQQYLKERFPTARISIRNGPDESVALAYARLIMAQHAFAAPDSTFSLFPVLATFGKGYHIEASLNAGMSRGVTRDRALVVDDPHVVFVSPGAKLPVPTTTKLRLANRTMAREEILKWFRVDDYNITFNLTE